MVEYDTPLISIEGLDKSGKSSLIENLKESLDGNWYFTQEPSDGPYGQLLRTQLAKDEDPNVSDLFLFLADRYDHIENEIKPALDDPDVDGVITDRYHFSTIAYQSSVVEEQLDVNSGFAYINRVTKDFHLHPELTIVLDIPVEVSLERMDGEVDKYENREKLEQAAEFYSNAENRYIYASQVDGTETKDEILEQSLELINEVRI